MSSNSICTWLMFARNDAVSSVPNRWPYILGLLEQFVLVNNKIPEQIASSGTLTLRIRIKLCLMFRFLFLMDDYKLVVAPSIYKSFLRNSKNFSEKNNKEK